MHGLVSGRLIDVLNLQQNDINVWEFAWGLSHLNRYLGHTSAPWSVLSHTGLVLQLYIQENKGVRDIDEAIQLLIHDALEAYIGDMIRPLKKHSSMVNFSELEKEVTKVIYRRFGYDYDKDVDHSLIDRYDYQASHVEMWTFWPDKRRDPQFICPEQYPLDSYPSLTVGKVQDYVMYLKDLCINSGKAPHIPGLFEIPASMEHLLKLNEPTGGPTTQSSPEVLGELSERISSNPIIPILGETIR